MIRCLYLRVHEVKRRLVLKVHEDGFKPTEFFFEWPSAVVSVR
jgi:hypothetical protein